MNSEDACIYFQAQRFPNPGNLYEWYAIKNTTKSGACLSPVFDNQPLCSLWSTCVALGPVIYVLGGRVWVPGHKTDFEILDNVYMIDTLDPEGGWKEGPRLLEPRDDAYAVAIENKLYAIGNGYTEVLEDNRWSSLQPVHGSCAFGHAVLDGGKRILVNMPALLALYQYDVEANTWDIYDAKYRGVAKQTAFVDGIMYSYEYAALGVIYAYDVTKPGSSKKRVLGLEDDLRGILPDALLHVGNGKLCVLYALRTGVDYEVLRVFCLKFQVFRMENKVSGEVDFVAYSRSQSDYYCDGARGLLGCLAVFPSKGTKAQDGVCNKDHDTTSTTIDENIDSSSHGVNTTSNKKKKKKKKKKKVEKKLV